MSITRYDLDANADGYFDDPFMKVRKHGKFILHSDYAALLTRHNALRYNTKVIIKAYRENRTHHNALVEAVAWMLECDACPLKNTTEAEKHGFAAIWATRRAARAEVDKLLQKEPI